MRGRETPKVKDSGKDRHIKKKRFVIIKQINKPEDILNSRTRLLREDVSVTFRMLRPRRSAGLRRSKYSFPNGKKNEGKFHLNVKMHVCVATPLKNNTKLKEQ